eukprot:365910-Chlamydomonas_euryale.AAC.43
MHRAHGCMRRGEERRGGHIAGRVRGGGCQGSLKGREQGWALLALLPCADLDACAASSTNSRSQRCPSQHARACGHACCRTLLIGSDNLVPSDSSVSSKHCHIHEEDGCA